jgi:flagellar hook-associated protein 3 FlgL
MITNLDPASELFLANVERIQQRVAEANRQVSSGKKVVEPSDAPDQIDSILQLRADRQQNAQIRSNLAMALTDVQSADGALSAAIRVMDRARVLGSQGASSTLDAASRQTLASEVQSLLEQMVAFSQTVVQGRYIFSGDREDAHAYQTDAAAPTGVVRLVTAAATRRIEDPRGGTFSASKTAQEIFDNRNPDDTAAGDNVFAALNSLRAAILTADPATSAVAIDAVKAASNRLNAMQAFYGSVQNRIDDAASFAGRYETDIRKQLSQKEDADVASAAIEATTGGTQLQAAFQMRALLPRRSLFEFIG